MNPNREIVICTTELKNGKEMIGNAIDDIVLESAIHNYVNELGITKDDILKSKHNVIIDSKTHKVYAAFYEDTLEFA